MTDGYLFDQYASLKPTLNYHLNTRVTGILPTEKLVKTSTGLTVEYDILVLATGSSAALPGTTPGHDAKGVFLYRSLNDLQQLIEFSEKHKDGVGVTVGGGLLGLEAAKSMLDMNVFSSVKLVDRNRWVLARQLDGDAGALVTEKIRELGLDVLLRKRVARINVDNENCVEGITFEDGEYIECNCICFAVCHQPGNCTMITLTPVLDWRETARRSSSCSRDPLLACWRARGEFRPRDVRARNLRHWGMCQLGEQDLRCNRSRYRDGGCVVVQSHSP